MSTAAPAAAPRPWQQAWNGKNWQDMPGADSDTRKLNFYLYRRGKLVYHDGAWRQVRWKGEPPQPWGFARNSRDVPG